MTTLCACGGLKTKDLAGKYSFDTDDTMLLKSIEIIKYFPDYKPETFDYTFEIDENGIGRLTPGPVLKAKDSNTYRDKIFNFDTKEMLVFTETGLEHGIGDKFIYDNGKITFHRIDGYI